MTIYVYLADGDKRVWAPGSFTSYTVEGGLFIVQRDAAWIGIYPIGQLRAVEVIE